MSCHPDQNLVIPICPEPIKKQDGNLKNDCDQNAGKRFLTKFREDHPKLKVIFIEDALSSKSPRISDLKAANVRFIIGSKPGSNPYIFERLDRLEKAGRMNHFEVKDTIGQKILKTVTHRFRYFNNLLLTPVADIYVNFFEYWEVTEWIDKDGVVCKQEKHFSWITDFELNDLNLMTLMRGERTRWGIENETFNTLKNQGYEFEHNFGHGYKHLSTCFAYLMMLAFLVDQAQQLSCELFQKALEKAQGTRRTLWEAMRVLYDRGTYSGWTQFLEAIAFPEKWRFTPINSS